MMLWLPAPRRGLVGPCGSAYTLGKAATFGGGHLSASGVGVFSASTVALNCWLYVTDDTTAQLVCGKYDTTAGNNNEWYLWIFNGDVRWTTYSASGTSSVNRAVPALGTWFNVWVWTSAGQPSISVNDGAVSTGSTPGAQQTNQQVFRVGKTVDGIWPYTGRIDALGIYTGAVPAAGERTSIYNAGTGKAYPSLSGAEKTNMDSWFEMGEVDGVATYCDFHGSNNLTVTAAVSQADGKT